MKTLIMFILLVFSVCLLAANGFPNIGASAQEGRSPQDVYMLAKESKLGSVKFSHLDHITKNRGIDGKQIACVECHHTAQPAAEAAKNPLHKTVWPADRTTTLTADLLKDASAPPVNRCTECHARAGTKPTLIPAIPQTKLEGSAEPVSLTNQQAFHRNCGGCHDQIAKTKQTTAPTSKKCVGCHQKTAA